MPAKMLAPTINRNVRARTRAEQLAGDRPGRLTRSRLGTGGRQ